MRQQKENREQADEVNFEKNLLSINRNQNYVGIPRLVLESKILYMKVWPKVDVLICFYSDGFPYLKAWRYVRKNKPMLINNLDKQQLLWDRTVVYDILKKIKVPVAKHYMIFRDPNYIYELEKRNNGHD